jgi:hypothetical protein
LKFLTPYVCRKFLWLTVALLAAASTSSAKDHTFSNPTY